MAYEVIRSIFDISKRTKSSKLYVYAHPEVCRYIEKRGFYYDR